MKNILTLLIIVLFSISSKVNAQTNVSGALSSDTTWSLTNSPYIVTGNILVPSGVTLTIEAGVTVKVSSSAVIQNNGTLIAIGTSTDKITFTSNESSPSAGDWKYIFFSNTSTDPIYDGSGNYIEGSTLQHVDILYGGSDTSKGVIEVTDSSLYVENIIVKNSASYGVHFSKSSGGSVGVSKIISSEISNNSDTGIYCDCYQYNKSITVENSRINNNAGYGISTGGGDAGGTHIFNYKNNIINNNSNSGILANANGTQNISGNLIYNNTGYGVRSRGNGTYTIEKNIIVGNNSVGVHGIYATHIIDNNVIAYNAGGIEVSQGGNYIVSDNQIVFNNNLGDGSGFDSQQAWSPDVSLTRNTFYSNTSTYSTIISFQPDNGDPSFVLNNNNIYKNISSYEFKNYRNSSTSTVDAENNYWGSTAESEMQTKIFDWSDDGSYGIVDYAPFLTSPNTAAPISPASDVIKSVSGTDVVITWSANQESDTDGYKLYFGNPTGYSYSNSIDLGNVTTYTIVGGNISTEYAITVYDTSLDGVDDMVDGNESWFSIANTLPELPTNIIVDVAPRKAKLTWDISSSSNATEYKIFRDTSPNPNTLVATISSTATSYEDNNLDANTAYYYTIQTLDDNGLESALSQDFVATPTNTWYVATTGTTNGFGSLTDPMNAIQTAVDAAINSEIVEVANGTYFENVIVFEKIVSVTTSDPSQSATTTIIDGQSNGFPVFQIDGNGSNLNNSTADLVFSGFTLKNGLSPTSEVPGGLHVKSTYVANINIKLEHLILENNTSTNAAAALYCYYTDKIKIKDVIFRNNTGTNIFGGFNAPFEMEQCIFFDNNASNQIMDFWHNGSTSTYSTIKNTLLRNNLSTGGFNSMDAILLNTTVVESGSNNAFRGKSGIVNSIFGSNQIISSPSGLLTISNSFIKDGQSSIGVFPSFLTYQNNLSGLILFEDETSYNYKLSDYSQGIGDGLNSINLYGIDYELNTSTYLDLENNLRPNPAGSNVDMGAYENALANTLHNTTIYVDPTGNDLTSVGLETAPFETIQAAIDYAIDGDEILVKPGTYIGSLLISKEISLNSTTGYQNTILKTTGNNANIITVYDIEFDNVNPIQTQINGFTFESDTYYTEAQNAIRIQNASFSKIEKCYFKNIDRGLSTYYGYYEVENSLFNNVNNVAFHDAGFVEESRISKITYSSIINASTILSAQPSHYLKIYNSIIARNPSVTGIYFNAVNPYLSKVLIDSAVNAKPLSVFQQINNLESVYFNDIAAGDFSLQNSSPAIGYGGYLSILDDLNNNLRSTTGFPDAGAIENTLNAPVNAAPLINPITNVTVDEDATAQTVLLTGISDGDIFQTQNLTLSYVNSNPSLFSNFELLYTPNESTATINFTPIENANGTANITITIQDDGGTLNNGVDLTSAMFSINITPINDSPIALTENIIVDEGGVATILDNTNTSVLDNDTDAESTPLTAVLVDDVTNGVLILNNNGTFSYTHNGTETTTDSFTYKANDGELDSQLVTVTIAINLINENPIALTENIIVDEGGVATILDNTNTSVLDNDTDAESTPLTAVLVDDVTNGVLILNNNGTFSYTHNGTETTTDSFTYKANDGELDSQLVTVTIAINLINENTPTDIYLSNNNINENSTNNLVALLTAEDIDLPNDNHTFELISGIGDDNNSSFEIVDNDLININSFDFETQQVISIRVKVTDDANQTFEKQIELNIVNINDIYISSSVEDSFCTGSIGSGSININEIFEANGSLTFAWTASNGGEVPLSQVNNQNLTDLTNGTYSVTISDDFFTYIQDFEVNLIPQYNNLSICYVSSDDVEFTKNRVYINNEGNYNVSNFEILRESNVSNVYESIGFMSSTENSFLDDLSNNMTVAYRYKVRLIDECGNSSNLSALHKTILLQSSVAVNNSVNLSWTNYEGTNYNTYDIYRKVNNLPFELIGSISSSNNSYNDQSANIATNTYEYFIAIGVDACSISSNRMMDNEVSIKSNIQNIGSNLSTEVNLKDKFKIYPNPTNNILNIKFNEDYSILKIEVFNSLGQKIIETKDVSFSVEALETAVYTLKILTNKGSIIKNFIKK